MKQLVTLNNPNLLELIIDNTGCICEASGNIPYLAFWDRKEVLGKKLSDLFTILEPMDQDFLDLDFIRKNPVCPDNLFIKSQHPSILRESNTGIFQFSYTSWFKDNAGKSIRISLAPQRFNSPIAQWLMCLYRRLSQPMVLTHCDFRIHTYNTEFLTLLNFFEESKIAGSSLFSFIEEQYQHPNPFLNDEKVRYIKSLSEKPGNPWEQNFDLFTKSGLLQSLKARFVMDRVCISRPLPDTVALCPGIGAGTSYMIYSKAVNFPNQDMRIECICVFEHNCEVTIGFGRPFSGSRSFLFDLGYQFDLRFSQKLVCQFRRRNALLASGIADHVEAGTPFTLTLTRIGAHMTLEIGDKRILEYPDTSPLFGTYTSHLYMYFWQGIFSLKKMTISTRPSELDMDTIASEQLIAFKTTPEKLYRFRSEPIRYIQSLMYAITFEHIPVLLQSNRKSTTITLIEEARDYIQKNYFRKIDFPHLARQCGISYKLFTGQFNDLYKFTPKAYQMEWKLKEARILLKSGKYKIQEVGEMVGFEDAPNFQHIFKKKFGKAPGEWAGKHAGL